MAMLPQKSRRLEAAMVRGGAPLLATRREKPKCRNHVGEWQGGAGGQLGYDMVKKEMIW